MTTWYNLFRWERGARYPGDVADMIERGVKHSVRLGHPTNGVPLAISETKFLPVIDRNPPLTRPGQVFSEVLISFDFGPPPAGYSIDAWFDENRGTIQRAINDPA